MTDSMKYNYSQLSAESVNRLVAANYPLGAAVQSRFYVLGLHDNYLVECAGGKYILRIYRNDWRSPEEVFFELELLSYLQDRSAPVAGPVRTREGSLAFPVASPEGERLAALFDYAEGRAPGGAISVDECVALGRAVATVHRIAASFATSYTRPVLELPYLIDESIAAIEPFIDIGAAAVLGGLQDRLHRAVPHLPKQAETYGICTGDVNPRNFHMDCDNRLTLFDFDQCGYGFRAFELGKFSSSIHFYKDKTALLPAFLDGYQEVRKLKEAERAAIPYFEMVSVIWVMAIHAKNVNRIGYKYLEKPFWDKQMDALKQLDARQPA